MSWNHHEEKKEEFVVCECGYNNKLKNINFYGTCTCCGKILNEQAKFRYDMYKKLRLWKGKNWRF